MILDSQPSMKIFFRVLKLFFGLLLGDSFENIFVFRKSKTSSSLILKFSLNGLMNFGSDEFWRFCRLEHILIIFACLVSLWQFSNFAKKFQESKIEFFADTLDGGQLLNFIFQELTNCWPCKTSKAKVEIAFQRIFCFSRINQP